jgi:hypothetical protein
MAAPADAHEQVLVLRAEHRALRRALGPTPWVALEALVGRALEIDGLLVAEVSVRSLAAELGVAKDTAARALAALRAEGVIVVHQSRTALGRFGTASYAIATGEDVFAIALSVAKGRVRLPCPDTALSTGGCTSATLAPRGGLIPMMTTSARATHSHFYRQVPAGRWV